MCVATATMTPWNDPTGRSNSAGKGSKGCLQPSDRSDDSQLVPSLYVLGSLQTVDSLRGQIVVGVGRAHRSVLQDRCTFWRWRPRHRALERPGAESVHDHGPTDGAPVDLALLSSHSPVCDLSGSSDSLKEDRRLRTPRWPPDGLEARTVRPVSRLPRRTHRADRTPR